MGAQRCGLLGQRRKFVVVVVGTAAVAVRGAVLDIEGRRLITAARLFLVIVAGTFRGVDGC
jgi:hypothetical protein